MKKKLVAVFISVILMSVTLIGCGMSFSKVKMSGNFTQRTDYIVYSNGGNAVQYGDIVYFINGTRGYEDTDAKQNRWGEVVKGALYKTKLLGSRIGDSWDFGVVTNVDTGLDFVSRKGNTYADTVYEDSDGEPYTSEQLADRVTDLVNVELVAPKTIGTSGYSAGGVFIYDNYIYYATPHNTKSKAGVVLTGRTDFMRTSIDGTHTQLIFTTEEDSANQPYAFYKQGNSVYLVCYYGTTIVSVEMKDGKTRIEKPMRLTDKATSVLFSVRDVYDSRNNVTNDPEDFIYFTRAVSVEDGDSRSGNVVMACRPNGSESFTVLSTGATYTLDALTGGGLVYYYTNAGGNIEVKFDNLHTKLMDASATYRAAENYKQANTPDSDDAALRPRFNIHIDVLNAAQTVFETYTKRHYIKDSKFSNECLLLAFTGSNVWLRSQGSHNYSVLNSGAEMHFINDGYLYYNLTGGTAVYRTKIFMSATEKTTDDYVLLTKEDVVTSGLKTDLVAGHIVYFSRIDEWADAYTYFRKVSVDGGEDFAVYMRNDADVKPEDEDEE